MIDRVVQTVLAVLVLVAGASLEETLPRVFGVGFPVLMAAVAFFAVRPAGTLSLAFAVVAGAVEDVLAGLPPMTSVSSFLALAFLVRRFGLSRSLLVLAYPCYQVWLSMWMAGIGGEVFRRVLVACPVGLVTAFAVDLVLGWLCRKAAAYERG